MAFCHGGLGAQCEEHERTAWGCCRCARGGRGGAVNTADWIVLAFVAAMAAFGYAQGLIVGISSLFGFVGGALAGAKLAPQLLADPASPYASLIALAAAVLLGGVAAAVLETLAAEARRRMRGALGVADGVGGALLLAVLGLLLAWIVGTALARFDRPPSLRQAVQRSAILSYLGEHLPRPSFLLEALAKLDTLPRIPAPDVVVGAPDPALLQDPDVQRAAGSVVRVLGTACGLGSEGSGWLARPGVVVTNAHVVAGQVDTTVQLRGVGMRYSAQAIWFDPRNDVAILSVPALQNVPSLALAPRVESGQGAAVIGYPLNGPLTVGAARVGGTYRMSLTDIYERERVVRSVLAFRGEVRPGNSGGPLVDAAGRVVGTVFAAARNGSQSGAAVPNDVVRAALARAAGPVSTGHC